MTTSEAGDLISRHDQAVKRYNRMTRTQLSNLYRRQANLIFGGPVSKDELISALVDLDFPLATVNEARTVRYA